MVTYDESILSETKVALGIAEDVTVFDFEIRMHINSALGTLNQLGIGPEGGFEISDASTTWTEFLLTDLQLSPVKTYVHLRTKLLFDPPTNSWVATAMKDQIEQLEWRINMVREDYIKAVEVVLPSPDDPFELDGGYV